MIARNLTIAMLALTACIFLTGCEIDMDSEPAGPLVTDNRSISPGAGKSASVELDLNVGELKLSGGATDLMSADFRYNVPEWKPKVQYTTNGDQGKLVVRQPDVKNLSLRRTENHWDIRLSDTMPIDLKVLCSTGSSTLDLSTVQLTNLNLDCSTGSITVDLDGKHSDLSAVRIDGDTGSCTLRMTGEYADLQSLDASTNTGSVTADLSGRWTRSMEGRIHTDTGSITVDLPADVGVYVQARKDTGNLTVDGVARENGTFTNKAYGSSPVTLRLNVSTHTGSITLRTAE